MAKKVGIPRGLFYYQFYPLWKKFFEELGAEIVVSDNTTKKILDDGTKSCVDQACLPVKLFHGHVLNLKDRVDYIFIPRLTSISAKEYICPKFGGLPDMVRHSIKDLPAVIDVEVNARQSPKGALKAAIQVGGYFSDNISDIRKAYNKAMESYTCFTAQVKQGEIPFRPMHKEQKKGLKSKKLNIAVIGHVYNLYDEYVNMNMLRKLEDSGVNIITLDMLESSVVNQHCGTLEKRMFWNFGRKALGGALCLAEDKNIDGIIYVMSFGCGVDSFVSDLIERKIRRVRDVPFMVLTLDEHSGEAGMDTRLEAFIDMVGWRYKNETDFSAHG
ncbi:putative nucleotide-binding protein (sugar kinase/HSP70/actin superfamily) [Anaerobacterium chartisolvens]|uniref:Putative nucleotide-binding protein (Sugar kinase/HSP70/actin superfamily) n=1 Tax=Anaerobacterium chartisolvens TaxID=1297424 RepID=A0A369BBU1_9FIRM|nr:acyl-CoA dehydratase activase-related protein [Anaerobacterium chartisolvens]RCX17937.1 putative nucleotide-binding protein (sugar kinase/HSP70/actin superfamily) [Anaerobacterium chartisolvens]